MLANLDCLASLASQDYLAIQAIPDSPATWPREYPVQPPKLRWLPLSR
jgi:hypothetical protein